MFNFKNIKIKHKLLINFILFLVFFLVLSLIAVNGMLKQKFALTEINSRKIALDKNETINRNLLEIHLQLQQIVNWTGAGIDEKSILAAMKANETDLQKLKAWIRKTADESTAFQDQYEALNKAYQSYLKNNLDIINMLDLKRRDISIVNMFLMNVEDAFHQSEKIIFEIKTSLEKLNNDNYNQALVSFDRFLMVFVFITLISIALSLFFMFLIRKGILSPLNKLLEALKKMITGDLRDKIESRYNDEIGVLSKDFNDFIQNLCQNIDALKKHAEKVASNSKDLAANSEQSAASIQQIKASTTSVLNTSIMQKNKVVESSEQINIILDEILNLNETMEKSKQQMSQASSSVEEMAANIASVTDMAISADNASENLYKTSMEGQSAFTQLADSTTEVEKSSTQIVEMVQLIMDISEQTNLLAMNAAIEAAHAGEYGKGFSVVAEEIRQLADKSSVSGKEIQVIVKNISEKIKKNMQITIKTQASFEILLKEILKVKQSNSEIASAMGEQKSANRLMLETINALDKMISLMVTKLELQTQKGEKIEKELSELKVLSEEVSNAMEEEESALQETATASEHIKHISIELNEIANLVQNDFELFKT